MSKMLGDMNNGVTELENLGLWPYLWDSRSRPSWDDWPNPKTWMGDASHSGWKAARSAREGLRSPGRSPLLRDSMVRMPLNSNRRSSKHEVSAPSREWVVPAPKVGLKRVNGT